ncbi:MAG: hypothetical protein QNJ09_08795 [Paracoccaceae bacterium]|nr:hypothetical protein [Paracoccaceae bacterium]
MRYLSCAVAALALAACAPTVPDSGAGVGFDRLDQQRLQRDAVLEGRDVTTVPGPIDVQATPLDADGQPAPGAAQAANTPADQIAADANSGVVPLQASPSNPAPPVVTNAAGISGENDFAAVSDQRDIQADAALIARNRAQYQVIAPTDLPTRPGTNQPNIVEYALRTTNDVGTPLYRRGFTSESRYQRACAGYASSDLAQEAFLARGGPERDRLGLDPDGDGFACGWNPAPFRAVRGS